MKTTMLSGRLEREYIVDGAVACRMPAAIKHPFIVATRKMQGRVVHRPLHAETLWVDGCLTGTTARTMCGRWLAMVTVHMEAPEEFDLCDYCLIADWPGPCVYRLFDAEDNLLYVGCTINLFTRLVGHITGFASWAHLIARWEYEVYPDHDQALHAEMIAILNERPPHNRDLTDRAKHAARRPARFAHLITTPVGAA